MRGAHARVARKEDPTARRFIPEKPRGRNPGV